MGVVSMIIFKVKNVFTNKRKFNFHPQFCKLFLYPSRYSAFSLFFKLCPLLQLPTRHNPYPTEYLLSKLAYQKTHLQTCSDQEKQRKECELGQKLSAIFFNKLHMKLARNCRSWQMDLNCCEICTFEILPLIVQKGKGHWDWMVGSFFLQCLCSLS